MAIVTVSGAKRVVVTRQTDILPFDSAPGGLTS
jgi:hypothetical protein